MGISIQSRQATLECGSHCLHVGLGQPLSCLFETKMTQMADPEELEVSLGPSLDSPFVLLRAVSVQEGRMSKARFSSGP